MILERDAGALWLGIGPAGAECLATIHMGPGGVVLAAAGDKAPGILIRADGGDP